MPTITFRRPQVEAQHAVRAMWAKAYKEGVDEYRNALVSLPTGCIAGDAVIIVNRGVEQEKHTLEGLYKKFHGLWESRNGFKWDPGTPSQTLSSNDGWLRLNEILNVIDKGFQATWEVVTEDGKRVKATIDHPFWSNGGWVELKDLKVGDSIGIMIQGRGVPKNPKLLYPTMSGLDAHPYACKFVSKRKDRNDEHLARVPTHRLVMEAAINEMTLNDFVSKVRSGDAEELTFLGPKEWLIHHLDGNTKNFSQDNLAIMACGSHEKHHGTTDTWKNCNYRVGTSKIVSIEPAGEQRVYDIAMKGPNHSFVVNGILVHNCGKSITALELVHGARQKNHRVLWLAHRRRLLNQAAEAYEAVWDTSGTKIGFVQASDNDVDSNVTFAMFDTLRSDRRLAQYLDAGVPDLVVVDEAHHSVSPSHQRVLKAIDEARVLKKGKPAFKVALTATVERADGKELGTYWTKAYSCTLLDALDPPEEWDEDPYLVPFVPKLERLYGLVLPEPKGDDYDDNELGHALLLAGVVQHTVKVLDKHAKNRRPMVYCATVEQARETTKALCVAGWSADYIFGTTSEEERERKIRFFEEAPVSKRPCLVNVAVLTEGTDIPCADCIVFCRPTKSKSLYIQVLGRGLRLFPGKKDCVIIDIAGASQEHDLISAPVLLQDMEREKKARISKVSAGSRPDALNGITKSRRRIQIDWIEIPGLDRRAFAVNAGEHGTVALIQDPALKHADLWDAVWITKGEKTTKEGKSKSVRTVEKLSRRAVDIGMATALGTDIARRALRLTGANGKRSWVDHPMSDAQRDRLFRMYVHHMEDLPDLTGMTKGRAQELLDMDLIARQLEAKGLAKLRRHQ